MLWVLQSSHGDAHLSSFVSAWHWELMRGIPLLEHHLVGVVQKSHQILPPLLRSASLAPFAAHPASQQCPRHCIYCFTPKRCLLAHRTAGKASPLLAKQGRRRHLSRFRILNNYLCHPLHTCAPSESDNAVPPQISCACRGALFLPHTRSSREFT